MMACTVNSATAGSRDLSRVNVRSPRSSAAASAATSVAGPRACSIFTLSHLLFAMNKNNPKFHVDDAGN